MTDPSSRFHIPATVAARSLGDEVVILDLVSGTYYGLDDCGKRIWDLFSEGRSIGETCEALLVEYDAGAETVLADVQRLAGELLDRKLIAL
jgi:hypothetical protein